MLIEPEKKIFKQILFGMYKDQYRHLKKSARINKVGRSAYLRALIDNDKK